MLIPCWEYIAEVFLFQFSWFWSNPRKVFIIILLSTVKMKTSVQDRMSHAFRIHLNNITLIILRSCLLLIICDIYYQSYIQSVAK